jgi:hypothetical protein
MTITDFANNHVLSLYIVEVEDFLKSKGIEFILYEHPVVYTYEEAEKYCIFWNVI